MNLLARIQGFPVFSQIPSSILSELIAASKVVIFPKWSIIFSEGQKSDHKAYVILSGVARVFIDEHPISFLTVGDVFGEYALMFETDRTATVKTHETLECLELSADVTKSILLQNDSPLCELIIRRMKENSSGNRGIFRDDIFVKSE